MVAYSFKPRFIDPIMAGTKRQTIRAIGKRRHAWRGDQLQLYTGMRTKQCRLIARAVCSDHRSIVLNFKVDAVCIKGIGDISGQLDEFSCLDGFESWDEMKLFWRAEHGDIEMFHGVIIQWRHILTEPNQVAWSIWKSSLRKPRSSPAARP